MRPQQWQEPLLRRACQVSSMVWQVAPRQRWTPYERPHLVSWAPPTMHPPLGSGRPHSPARQAHLGQIWPAPCKTPS